MPTTDDHEKKKRDRKQIMYQPCRSYHNTIRTEIAQFLPEVVIATGIIGGWVVYRTSQGKPLTPDDALECQDAHVHDPQSHFRKVDGSRNERVCQENDSHHDSSQAS